MPSLYSKLQNVKAQLIALMKLFLTYRYIRIKSDTSYIINISQRY